MARSKTATTTPVGSELPLTTCTHILDLAKETEPPAEGILSRTIHQDDRIKAVDFGFGQGQELSEHRAAKPAMLFFVKGEATVGLGDDIQEAQPGTWVHLPANLKHSIKAALFGMAFVSFNVLNVIATAIRAVHGEHMQDEFSLQQAAEGDSRDVGGACTWHARRIFVPATGRPIRPRNRSRAAALGQASQRKTIPKSCSPSALASNQKKTQSQTTSRRRGSAHSEPKVTA